MVLVTLNGLLKVGRVIVERVDEFPAVHAKSQATIRTSQMLAPYRMVFSDQARTVDTKLVALRIRQD